MKTTSVSSLISAVVCLLSTFCGHCFGDYPEHYGLTVRTVNETHSVWPGFAINLVTHNSSGNGVTTLVGEDTVTITMNGQSIDPSQAHLFGITITNSTQTYDPNIYDPPTVTITNHTLTDSGSGGGTGTPPPPPTDQPPGACQECSCNSLGQVIWQTIQLAFGIMPNPDGSCPSSAMNSDKGEGALYGMAYYNIDPYTLGMSVIDRPLPYRAPIGPSAQVALTHATGQAMNPLVSNLSSGWSLNWVQYLDVSEDVAEDDILNTGKGGRASFGGEGGKGPKGGYGKDRLFRMSAENYEHRLSNGIVETYSIGGGTFSGRKRLFLREVKDVDGLKVTLTWTPLGAGMRLSKITDATNKATTIQHNDPSHPMRITSITDPFGRVVVMDYVGERLQKLTDPVGVTSQFGYVLGEDRIESITTPYGSTSFERGNLVGGGGKYLQITDPMGRASRVEYRPSVAVSDLASEPGTPEQLAARAGSYSFYWDNQAYQAGLTLENARAIQWSIDSATGAQLPIPPQHKRSARESGLGIVRQSNDSRYRWRFKPSDGDHSDATG